MLKTQLSKCIKGLEFHDLQNYDVITPTTVEEIKQYAEQSYQKSGGLNVVYVYRRPKKCNP